MEELLLVRDSTHWFVIALGEKSDRIKTRNYHSAVGIEYKARDLVSYYATGYTTAATLKGEKYSVWFTVFITVCYSDSNIWFITVWW